MGVDLKAGQGSRGSNTTLLKIIMEGKFAYQLEAGFSSYSMVPTVKLSEQYDVSMLGLA